MFVQKKKNRSGVISIPVLEKRDCKSVLVKTIGNSRVPQEIDKLFEEGSVCSAVWCQQTLQFESEQNIKQMRDGMD